MQPTEATQPSGADRARRLISLACIAAKRAVSAARQAARIAQDEWARQAGIPDTRDDDPGEYEQALAEAKRPPTVRAGDPPATDYWRGSLDRAFLAAHDAVIAFGRATNISAGDAISTSRPLTEIAASLCAARFAVASAQVVAAAGRLAADSLRGEWIAGNDLAVARAAKLATESEDRAKEAAELAEQAGGLIGYEPGGYRRSKEAGSGPGLPR